jgi:hypothetical protein
MRSELAAVTLFRSQSKGSWKEMLTEIQKAGRHLRVIKLPREGQLVVRGHSLLLTYLTEWDPVEETP